uniref:Uncharacterized protein MANES_02G068300 n=1 Tax=Rhizophora mucronata TaxID=61149 RepID=A0A2P2K3D0_RHIMU
MIWCPIVAKVFILLVVTLQKCFLQEITCGLIATLLPVACLACHGWGLWPSAFRIWARRL